jgi:acetyltransferase
MGLRCYPNLSAVAQPIDCVVLTTAKERTLEILEEAENVGVRAAVVLASGFAEGGSPEGKELEDKLRNLVNRARICVCGPNCLGLINVRRGVAMWGGPNPHRIKPGIVGAVMQSGSYAITYANSMIEREVGLSFLVSCGNSVNVDIADYMDFMVDDPATEIIVAYVEGFRDGPKFLNLANKAAAKGKPIVVLKVGRSRIGARAAVAHTGALVGSDPVYDAIFRQKGVIRVYDFDELTETVFLLASHRSLGEGRIGVMSISGGETGVIADLGEIIGLKLPDFSEETKGRLVGLLPSYVTVCNPLDSAGARMLEDQSMASYARCLQTLAQDPGLDVVLVSQDARKQSYAAGKEENELFRDIAKAVGQVARRSSTPFVCLSPASGQVDETGKRILEADGVPLLQGLRPGLQAVANTVQFSRFQIDKGQDQVRRVAVNVDVAQIRSRLISASGPILSEDGAEDILSQYGIPVARGRVARSEQEVLYSVREIGLPVALKVISADVSHRTDVGGVVLGVASHDAALCAYRQILENVRQAKHGAMVEGVLVQEMVPGGIEAIVGISRDPQFGPVILCGIGGVFVEVVRDVARGIPPIGRRQAEAMLRELKGYPVLNGARGGPKRDVNGLIDVLVRVSEFACDTGDLIDELDINPLMVLEDGKGVRAVDALLVLRR